MSYENELLLKGGSIGDEAALLLLKSGEYEFWCAFVMGEAGGVLLFVSGEMAQQVAVMTERSIQMRWSFAA